MSNFLDKLTVFVNTIQLIDNDFRILPHQPQLQSKLLGI